MSCHDETAATLPAGATLQFMGVERACREGGCGGEGAGVGAGVGAADGTLEVGAVNGGGGGEEPPRKRAKPPADDVRARLADHKLLRLKHLRDRLTEQLSELYFLQAGGNMIDYGTWRRRAPDARLQAWLEARRPPPPPPALPVAPPAAATPTHDEALERARAEAQVSARVSELARCGLWAERRLPRVLEPPRHKAHWDYLLEEMAWLAQDFAHERKWKRQAAKKVSRAVQRYWSERAGAAARAERAVEAQLRRVAAVAARDVRAFWLNVHKVVEWKRSRRVERERRRALEEQLSYVVDRTERYSRQVARGLQQGATPSPPHSPHSDYAGGEDSADDEDTIAEQERAERPQDVADELDELRREQDLDLADLVRRYQADVSASASATSNDDTDTDSDEDSEADSESGRSLGALVDSGHGGEDGERRVEAAASAAAALQPRGTTLASAGLGAGTPAPSLLRHALREYQHVGLHWLATMHDRALNGILADEMGLGKTIQTIALLAHLADSRADWGPHLIVAPTSLILNWEMEFKKWCPAFKILTYYGTIRERKLKRVGWTKPNCFHVCITSYKLVVQDHQSFRRKRWKYLVLDEAQNIKNFKSQRWQTLLNFQTERRLLVTGTPLQNSLAELWSLLHFLMPAVFASHAHFREWFAGVAAAAEGGGGSEEEAPLVRRLHAVLRPFLLRRLKADVERQLPRKYEHVLLCRLANRQRYLYDDFMSRAKTKESLASGNLLSVINVLMQLRKVCNHPDLFEPRPVTSPLHLGPLSCRVPALVLGAGVGRADSVAARLGGALATLEASGAGAFPAHRARHLAPPRRALESSAETGPPPSCRPPPAALRMHLRLVPRTPSLSTPAPPLTAPPSGVPLAADGDVPRPVAAPPPSPAVARMEARRRAALRRLAANNERRCWRQPLYGADLRCALSAPPPPLPPPFVPPSLDRLVDRMLPVIERFSVVWSQARAPAAQLCAGAGRGARAWRRAARAVSEAARVPLDALLRMLHKPAAAQAQAFPHPSLLQYDCGKLQTLATLVRSLVSGGHRALVFTQMTRVLDVLESFFSALGLAYLRLDGATPLDHRQRIVDTFNADRRVFALILSTRSGGLGLNLTGADTVIFYDSDWNPTWDAQAQDRAHRIGQTRDVHVYRLVTAGTVEENILRKADQKRRLGDLAIDSGRFDTSYLRQSNIRELFECGGEETPALGAVTTEPAEVQARSLEVALCAAEDEADAAAARAARDELCCDLAEFEDAPAAPTAEAAPPPVDTPHDEHSDDELAAVIEQLRPIERYAMRMVERSEEGIAAERAALEELRRQHAGWRAARTALVEPSEASGDTRDGADITYSREDADTQVWVSGCGAAVRRMPTWGPPTPPAGDGDVYCESWARALYRRGPAGDALLPASARAGRDPRSLRSPRHARLGSRPPRAPASLFERGAGGRVRARPRAPPAGAVPASQPDWAASEDAAVRRALRHQRLEAGASLAPNWEWVAEAVGEVGRAYRAPRACRDRHDALADPERARRKHKKSRHRADEDAPRPPLARLDAMLDLAERRRDAPKRRLDEHHHQNPKHAALLAEYGLEYDAPPTPMQVATRRADRIAKEKLKAGTGQVQGPATQGAGATQRVVVAHGSAVTPAPSSVASATPAAASTQLLYRQRHHLKILQHATASTPQTLVGVGVSGVGVSGVSVSGVGVSGSQAAHVSHVTHVSQVSLRPRVVSTPRPHLVVAHLAPHPAHTQHTQHLTHADPRARHPPEPQ